MLFVSFLITFSTAIFLASFFSGLKRISYLLSIYVFLTAGTVLCFEIAGLLHLLNSPYAFLGFQTLILGTVIILWFFRGKPSLVASYLGLSIRSIFKTVVASIRDNKLLSIFFFGILLVYAVNIVVILLMPPNNSDGFYLHMSRVGYWLQYDSFFPYPTFYKLQNFYPFNAQAQVFWTVLFRGTDQLAGFIQYFAAIFSSLAVFGIARLLGFRRPQALFASLLWLSFPQVFYQSTTVQNDLVPAAYLAISLYFLIYWSRDHDFSSAIYLSALSLALAVGTKQTILFILPGFLILFLLIGLKSGRFLKLALPFGVAFVVFQLFFGSLIYIQNWVVYKNIMGDPRFVRSESGGLTGPGVAQDFWLNLNRITYQSLDTSGLPPLIEGYLFRGKAILARKVYSAVGMPMESDIGTNAKGKVMFTFGTRYPVSEDFVWFGILAPFLLVITAIIQAVRSIRSRDPVPTGLICVSISFIIFELLFRPGWDINIGRNFTLAVISLVPFTAMVYQNTLRLKVSCAIIIALSLFMVFNLLLHNPAKPLVGENAIWGLTRDEKLTLQNGWALEPLKMVDKLVPGKAVLGIAGGFFEYPFFGEHFQRALIPLSMKQLTNEPYLDNKGIDYILVDTPDDYVDMDESIWKVIGHIPNWFLFQKNAP
jgi:4-amino-4-deoxy-L-arabinose transferase-like glycosyltransferase